jgi:hypothetical protein
MKQVVMSFSPVPCYLAPDQQGPFDCQELGIKWLDWVAEYSPDTIRKYELILLVRPQLRLPESVNAWGKLTRFSENSFIAQYPVGPNVVFKQVLWLQHHNKIQGPFLWCEPDCVPVKKDWLDLIAAAYMSGGKPFMGNVVEAFTNQHTRTRVVRHMTGNAVYPDKAYLHAPKLMEAHGTAWDVLAAEQILQKFHLTELIQHEFRAPEIRTLRELNAIIRPNTALFHSDKFGAIARLLGRGEEIDLEQTFSPVPLPKSEPDGAVGLTCNHGHGAGDFDLEQILEHLKQRCLNLTIRKRVARFLVEQNIVNHGHVTAYGKKLGRPKKKPRLSDEEFKKRIAAAKQDVTVAATD